jgi:replicative DNA helicase
MNAPVEWHASLEAEQSLLGALLLDNSVFGRVAGIIKASDFYNLSHAAIFRVVGEAVRRNAPADITTVAEAMLRDHREAFDAMGGSAYVANLAYSVPSSLHVERYAEIVHEKALCRHVSAFGLDLSQRARDCRGEDIATLIAAGKGRLKDLADTSFLGQGLRVMTATTLVSLELAPLEVLLEPWLFQKNLGMIHAKRGVGKTHFALGIAFAIASGSTFLGWRAPKRRSVLYVDGEMPIQIMQRRLQELTSSYGEIPDLLRIVTPDHQDKPMPDLATRAGQSEIDSIIDDQTDLVILDNLSALVRSGGAENESESWGMVSGMGSAAPSRRPRNDLYPP